MADRILEAFLAQQDVEGRALAAESDLLTLLPFGSPPDRYLVELRCKGLVERAPGDIVEADRFHVGVRFPSTYLRAANPFEVLTWLGPPNVWHPNISLGSHHVCVGRIYPGTGLVDILYQLYELVTWNKVTMREDDALNATACQWARRNPDRIPVDRRPLKPRPAMLHVADMIEGSGLDGAAE